MALIKRESVPWNNQNAYHIFYQSTCTKENIFFSFIICVFCNRIFLSDFDGLVIGPVASKSVVLKDRYKEREQWAPEEQWAPDK